MALFLALALPAAAENLAQGMHGMPWGSAISQYPRLVKVREAGPVTYYADADTLYSLSRQPVSDVIYGAEQGRFFAVYIKLKSPDQFYYTERHFRAQYGAPKRSSAAEGREVVYRWAKDEVKVKLKMNEATGDIKLGIYFVPIANTLNPEQAEEGPDEALRPQSPNKNENLNTRPLL
jgi:hypothetical protein